MIKKVFRIILWPFMVVFLNVGMWFLFPMIMFYRLYRSRRLPSLEAEMQEKLCTQNKKAYLASHDYGMGATWFWILAKSKKEIEDRYPKLDVFEDKPDWMSEDRKGEEIKNLLIGGFPFDLDEGPKGVLKLTIGADLKEAARSAS